MALAAERRWLKRQSASSSGATGDQGRMAHHYEEQAEVGLHSACRRGLRARSESANGPFCRIAGIAIVLMSRAHR